MKLVALVAILSCYIVQAGCTQCTSEQMVTVHQQWVSTFGSNYERLFQFGMACFLRSATVFAELNFQQQT